MPINTAYYGAESTWLNIPMDDTMPDTFMLGQYSTVSQTTYGLVSRTWLATKYGMNYETYKQPLDNSYGFCITDGNAPFDNIMYCTGYNNNYPNRIKTTNHGKSTVGFAGYGYSSSYVSGDFIQYYKTSSTGKTYEHSPLNFNPPYTFTPTIDEYANNLKIMRVTRGSISPALKYDFGYYYAVPFISYYVLKDEYTIADVDSVTDPANYDSLFSASYNSDLRRFYIDVSTGVVSADKIIISSICVQIYHVSWKQDGTYSYNDISSGTTDSTTLCKPIPFFHSDTVTELTFTDWYKTTDAESYTVNIDTSFVSQRFKSLGSNTRCYDGIANRNITASVSNATVIAGQRQTYGALYDNLTTYPYSLMPCAYDDNHFTVKWFEESELPNVRKYAVSVYTTLSSFGGLDNFREYVRKSIAYFGCYFSECLYPSATKEWNTTDCFIGTIDDNGVTHGNYTNGTDNDNQRQKTWGDEWSEKTPYDPTKPPKPDTDPNRYIDTMQGKNAASLTAFTKLYAVDGFNMLNLRLYLAHIPTEGNTLEEHQDYLYKHFLNSNPIDNIVSLKVYPFSILQYVFGNVYTTETIRISNALAEYALSDTATIRATGNRGDGAFSQITLFLGSFTLYTAYGDFRDYDPYSSAKLYLPYCGTATIDIKTILDKTLYVAYKVDIKTGSCTAVVTQDSYDGIIVLTAHGTMAVDIPITGIQTADYQNAIFQGITNLKNAQMQQFTSYIHAATGLASSVGAVATSPMAIPGAVTGIADSITGISASNNALKQAEYNLQTAPIKHTMVGSSSAGDAQLMYMYPALIVTRPKFLTSYNETVYAHTVGHACILSDTLGNFSGYTVVSDIDLSGVPATDAEQQMLRAILAAGVYL